ncbi:GNAT family N-acetyltransferase [Micromonospora sp. NPDC050397]|uniref:GNAT family N-acetyltransferase n=1 Tax=Micromonospora sp. NPDC050397 TaxID=3364279 RepID=UPI00384A64DD
MRIFTTRVVGIRRVEAADIEAIVETLVEASADSSEYAYLIPDRDLRMPALKSFYTNLIEDAVLPGRGSVWCTVDHGGAAVWHWSTASPLRAFKDDPCASLYPGFKGRATVLELLLQNREPQSRHVVLTHLGVAPQAQGKGRGSTLLRDRLKILDVAQMPSYLVATNFRSRALYLRFGYVDHGVPIELPTGASLYPMWRDFRPAQAT